jgi:hypothetical protein
MDDKERRALAKAAGGARPVGAYVARMLDPLARARGFATTALFSEWQTIVGAELATFTIPDRLVWPRRQQEGEEPGPTKGWRAEGAILMLRVDGPRAIEVQHRSDKILERVNTYFGYRAITEMRILQAPVARTKPPSPTVPEPSHDDVLPASTVIEDEGLRRALSRLGALARAKLTRG